MRLVILGLFMMLAACQMFQSTVPTAAPPQPALTIIASQRAVKVGETMTITASVVDFGPPTFMLSLTSGATAKISYQGEAELGKDDVFEFTDVTLSGSQATFTLKAVGVGRVDATVHATGELIHGDPSVEPVYYWSGDDTETVDLEAIP